MAVRGDSGNRRHSVANVGAAKLCLETTFTFDAVGRETSMRVIVPGVAADRVSTTSYWPSDQVRTHDESGAKGATENTFFNDDGRLARMLRDTATTTGGRVCPMKCVGSG